MYYRLFPLFVLLFVLGPQMPLVSQNHVGHGGAATEDYLRAAGDHAALYRGLMVTRAYEHEWMTHPYVGGKDFREGEVSYGGVVYSRVRLRYDALLQRLEVLTPVNSYIVVPDRAGVDYFVLDGHRYVPHGEGYVALEYEGTSLRLERRTEVRRASDVLTDGHAMKNLQTSEHFLLHDSAGDHEVSSLRHIKKLYPQLAADLSREARRQGLRFRGDGRGAALARCVRYIDEHLPATRSVTTHSTAEPAVTAIPDSLSRQPLSGEVPAYAAFREGGNGVGRQAEEPATAGSGGISPLKPLTEERTLPEMEVTAFQSKVFMAQMGAEKFRPAQLRNVPMAFGEADVMKMVQTLPGVKTMGEASSGFNVRGGAADQNLILVGGSTVYNPMHMFGMFSAFNTEAMSEVELYKSSIPAQYGGRISSVMNVSTRTADKKQWRGSLSAGLLTSKGCLEVPVVNDRVSLLVAARTTYSDWMLGLLDKSSEYRDGRAGFYDLSACLSWTVGPRHFVKAFGYYSHDRFSFTRHDRYAYANGNGSLELRSFWNERLSSTIQAGMSHYGYLRDEKEFPYSAARLSYHIREGFLRGNFALKGGERHSVNWGWDTKLYAVAPGICEPLGGQSYIQRDEIAWARALEGALYGEEEWSATEALKVNAGLRLNVFHSFSDGRQKTYAAPDVRLSAIYALTELSSLKLGANSMHQYLHKVSNTSIMSPTDTWALSDRAIKPQRGWQVAAGYYTWTGNHRYELSAEIYYKHMADYLTYRSAGQLVMNHNLENDVITARGRAYGIELQLRKPTGKLNGWISYSYSRTFLRQNRNQTALPVNGGDWYAAEYDRPNELKLVGNYRFTKRFSASLNLDYSTGRPTTVPAGRYYDVQQGRFLPFYTERNSYRLPDYFRMDASFNVEPSHHLTNKTHSWFSIGVYNLTGRKNVYSIYYEAQTFRIQGYKLSIFGAPIPFISYNIKF